MNWLTKALIVWIVLNGVVCDKYEEEVKAALCIGHSHGMWTCTDAKYDITVPITLEPLNVSVINEIYGGDQNKICCHNYEKLCRTSHTNRKYCKPDDKASRLIQELYHNITKECKPNPTKDLCAKYYKPIGKEYNCDQYAYSECESFTWSSFVPISPNGLILVLSLLVTILMNF